MTTSFSPALSRRQFLQIAAASPFAALAAGSRSARAQAEPPQHLRLRLAPANVQLVGESWPETHVWAYDGSIPGPVLRVRQGAPVEVTIENGLADDTTVHWHGIRLPNAMDGVPGLTQPPIKPGDKFTYAFTPPDAGTFWYHRHVDSLRQLGRGLAGALVVEERQPIAVDRDQLWVIQDWRLDERAQIAGGFGNRMEASMSGRVGNTVTINGRVPDTIPVRSGERLRLRIVNAASARIMALHFDGHEPSVVSYDGQPCEPHVLPDERLLLGPAMRADLILDMRGVGGRRYAIRDDFYGDELAYTLVELAYDAQPFRERALDPSLVLPSNPLPEPNLSEAVRHSVTVQGGMMSMNGGMSGMGMTGGSTWTMNGMSMTGDGAPDMKPLFTMPRGRSVVVAVHNESAWWHPMHLHGHSFRVLSRNGTPVPRREWRDTILMPPRENAEIAFVADNPGDWMFHCHVTDHQMTGLMTVFRIA